MHVRNGEGASIHGRSIASCDICIVAVDGGCRSRDARFVQNGKAGFVVTGIRYALGDDAARTGAYPRGMSMNVAEIYAATLEGKRRKGESDDAYGKRVEAGGRNISAASNGQNVCANPEAAAPSRTIARSNRPDVVADGIDLDGVASSANQPAAGGMSAPGFCEQDRPARRRQSVLSSGGLQSIVPIDRSVQWLRRGHADRFVGHSHHAGWRRRHSAATTVSKSPSYRTRTPFN